MSQPTSAERIRSAFLELSEPVRDWLTSDRASALVIAMNKKLDLFGSDISVIPRLITRLVVGDIHPKNFPAMLAGELGIDFPQAQELAKEIDEEILRPIANQLRDEAEVEVRDIYLGEAEVLPDERRSSLIAPELSERTYRDNATIRVQDVVPQASSQPPPLPDESFSLPGAIAPEPSPESPKEESQDKPFMIHEEKPLFTAPENGGPSFSFERDRKTTSSETIPSPTARIHSSKPGTARRVIHYSNLRTLLDKKKQDSMEI
ncbi:MAG: hypothetical protein COU08_00940 [Candidatus Harrisonbacteria bacterium CG10_big_fil_rev_8_21_14_0_10_42_17]|uniref:Uncharacterized protein n=1 Tax=Candidatus Harrisonbacteria bacterium CG10_big_fil_rev_8_21_14_0_10_42_17 TaxID=1974584 RepID=A0A2M6WJ04_9BACT|nr:MAG: hypothetical protein COU08_00940 [Candidatus Harrisonbacteria bacterium CG10_big_fil_rev_8_21_14_0_10_42_17]